MKNKKRNINPDRRSIKIVFNILDVFILPILLNTNLYTSPPNPVGRTWLKKFDLALTKKDKYLDKVIPKLLHMTNHLIKPRNIAVTRERKAKSKYVTSVLRNTSFTSFKLIFLNSIIKIDIVNINWIKPNLFFIFSLKLLFISNRYDILYEYKKIRM